MGVQHLKRRLNLCLVNHIKRCLPKIRESIVNVIQLKEYDLHQYGEYDCLEEGSKGSLILSYIKKFSETYINLISKKVILTLFRRKTPQNFQR